MSDTKTLKALNVSDPRGKLLSDLKRWIESKKRADKLSEGLMFKILVATHQYVSHAVLRGAATGPDDGIQKLANSLRRTHASVHAWYRLGKFVYEHKLPLDKGLSYSLISRAQKAYPSLTPVEQSKVINQLRSGKGSCDLDVVLLASNTWTQRQTVSLVARLERKGIFNKTAMKIQAMALKTFAVAFYGEGVRIGIYNNGETLLELK